MKKFYCSAYPNQEIRYNGKQAKFENGYLETDDKELIALFQKDGSIVEVSSVTETVSKRTKITQTTADQE